MGEFRLPQRSWGDGAPVVAVMHCQEALAALAGNPLYVGDTYEQEHDAVLTPEPDNPFDPKAVSVRINGFLVGYLPKADEAGYFDVVSRIAASGLKAVVHSSVFIRRRQDYNTHETHLFARIKLQMVPSNLISPLNHLAIENVAVLPWGDSKKVSGVLDHQQHLAQYAPAKEGVVILTLHKETATLRNGNERSTIHLRLDGEPVGILSPTTSANYIPTLDYAERRGAVLGIWARISGSAVATDLNTQGAVASKVSDAWLADLPTMPSLVPLALEYDVPRAFDGNNVPPLSVNENTSLEIREYSGLGEPHLSGTVERYDPDLDDMVDITNEPEVQRNRAEQARIAGLIVEQSNARIAREATGVEDPPRIETAQEPAAAPLEQDVPPPARTGLMGRIRRIFG